MQKPSISIIVPLFNRTELVKETILSVLNQTLSNWELIIVDDHSTDNSWDVVQIFSQSDPRIVCYKKPAELQKGPSSSRNMGAKLAKSDYLLFLDSDDLITTTCLERRFMLFNENPELDFIVFPQATFDYSPQYDSPLFSRYFNSREDYLKSFLSEAPPWQTSGPLWKKKSFLNLGGFREDYTMMEDPELHIRAILTGLNYEVVQGEPDFYYRLLPKTQEQGLAFYKHSIEGRIPFYRDMYILLSSNGSWIKYKKDLSDGLVRFLKSFFLFRSHQYKDKSSELLTWIQSTKLIQGKQLLFILLYVTINNSPVLRRFPLIKGGVYNMI